LRELENPDAELRSIFEILCKDAALAGKILTIANSAYYSRGTPISSLPAAIRVLGFSTIRDVVMSVATASMFSQVAKTARKPIARLWKHSLAAAYLCTLVAECARESSGDELFVDGLLHDIGKIPILIRFPDQAEQIEKAMQPEGGHKEICECEMAHLGFTHGQLGGALLEKWNFPDRIRGIVANHHQNEIEDDPNIDMQIVQLADVLSHRLQNEYFDEKVLEQRSEMLEISEKKLVELTKHAADLVDKDKEIFGI